MSGSIPPLIPPSGNFQDLFANNFSALNGGGSIPGGNDTNV